jgi:hypothetical protein
MSEKVGPSRLVVHVGTTAGTDFTGVWQKPAKMLSDSPWPKRRICDDKIGEK